MSTTADWDAKTYHRLAAPQEEWAHGVLERLPLAGDETVLDAGSGSGRVTRLLLDRLPEGRVIGVDGSPSMVEMARETLAEYGDRVDLVTSDLLDLTPELLAAETGFDAVDVVFSNATFHWVEDHPALFERLHSLLRPGGRLVAQCGGEGNVAEWVAAVRVASSREPFVPYVDGFSPWNFRGPEETERSLRAAGFEDIACSLERKVVHPEDPRGFVAIVGLASLHERMPGELREPFTDAVLAELNEPLELTYIRLNLDGVRGADA